MKELRYARKVEDPDDEGLKTRHDRELDEKVEGRVPSYRGSALTGFINPYGWQYQGFIEDKSGALRLQSDEEHRYCMGCHSGLGVTVDSSFGFPRKLPGAEGWKMQDLRGQKDVPQLGHSEPEVLTYYKRLGRTVDEKSVRRAAPGGDKDLAWLLTPPRAQALLFDKAYRVVVEEQSFALGRDALLATPRDLHRTIKNGSTGLEKKKKIYRDARLQLTW
jgi:hypothetical protein